MQKYNLFLDRLGMSEAESTIYLTLLEYPHLTIAELARRTRYHRPMIYRTLASLESEGYIERSILEGKRSYYHTTSPMKLREKLASLEHMAEQVFPELDALYDRAHDAPILSVKEGIDGIHSVHRDIIESTPKGGSYAIYISSATDSPHRSVSIPPEYRKIQKQKELSRHIERSKRVS